MPSILWIGTWVALFTTPREGLPLREWEGIRHSTRASVLSLQNLGWLLGHDHAIHARSQQKKTVSDVQLTWSSLGYFLCQARLSQRVRVDWLAPWSLAVSPAANVVISHPTVL
ncbi:glyceraldehyde-3-phosphate dehydrogenase [Apiospora arundinis]